jgi:hypothetical protein
VDAELDVDAELEVLESPPADVPGLAPPADAADAPPPPLAGSEVPRSLSVMCVLQASAPAMRMTATPRIDNEARSIVMRIPFQACE